MDLMDYQCKTPIMGSDSDGLLSLMQNY